MTQDEKTFLKRPRLIFCKSGNSIDTDQQSPEDQETREDAQSEGAS